MTTKAPKKTAAQLDREIAAYAAGGVRDAPGLSVVMRKFRTQVAAYQREIAALEAGTSTGWQTTYKIREKLRKLVEEAAGHAPLSYRDPIIAQLNEEIDALPKSSEAEERGRGPRSKVQQAESRKILDEIIERDRAISWMRK